MKYFIVIFFLVLFIHQQASSQSVRLGAQVGLNSSRLESDRLDGFEIGIGYNLGVLLDVKLADKWRFKPGVIYKAKKAKNEGEVIVHDANAQYVRTDNVEVIFRYGYLSLPFLVEYYAFSNLKISGGPNIDFNVSEKYTINNPDMWLAEQANPLVFGVNIGPTLLINNLELGLLYNKSLSSVSKRTDFSNFLEDETLSGFELNLAYFF